MVNEDLAEKFKDPESPLRLVFVCAMWMTGFDVKPLSTLYLDKPMKNHSLMQTIARANRVFRDKTNGLIVDYIGIFRNLQKALAIYAADKGDAQDTPIRPKEELIKELIDAIDELNVFCKENGVNSERIISADKLEKIKLIADAADALMRKDDIKVRFTLLTGNLMKLFKAILPDPDANRYYDRYALYKVIAERIRETVEVADITDVVREINELLDRSISAEGYVIREPHEPYGSHRIDLSKIDFDALRKKFDRGRRNTEAMRLRSAIESRLSEMVRLNRTRADYLEKIQKLIDEYNSGAINVEVFFQQLMEFAKKLNEEDGRKISEQLSEEELALFDLLKKEDLKNKEKQQVKLASKKLLKKLKQEKLVLDWRRKQQARAEVLFTIETLLDEMLPDPPYTQAVYEETCQVVYQHVYDSYYGAGKSIYS